MKYFQKTSGIQVTPQALEAWHHAPGAFQRLTPPWERMRIVEESAGIADGTRAVIEMKAGPFWTKWIAEHQDCCPGKSFSDIQVKGPFAHWKHLHQFQSATKNGCYLRDGIEYRLPMGILGNFFGGALVRRKLERTFNYRHAITKMDLERLAGKDDSEPLTILVTGATGMVGTALEAFLRMRGHEVRRVTRNPQRSNDVRWDVRAGEIDLSRDANIDAVVHLAGENIAGGRWSTERKHTGGSVFGCVRCKCALLNLFVCPRWVMRWWRQMACLYPRACRPCPSSLARTSRAQSLSSESSRG